MSLSSAIRTGLYGALQLVGSTTLGSSNQDISVSGLDIANDGMYMVVLNLKNSGATVGNVFPLFNGDTTSANYDSQVSFVSAASVSAGRANNPRLMDIIASSIAVGTFFMVRDVDGLTSIFGKGRDSGTTAIRMFDSVVGWRTNANVTTLTIRHSTSTFATGSYVKVYKIGAPVTQGTAFPTSGLVDGQRFFRTDLGLDCYYDSALTKWLTCNEYEMPHYCLGAIAQSAVNGIVNYLVIPSDYAVYLTRWVATTTVATTNTGAAYWTLALISRTATNVATTLSSFTTGATPDTVGQWTQHDIAINAVLDAAAKNMYYANTVKTGAPGNVTILAGLYFRKVIP